MSSLRAFAIVSLAFAAAASLSAADITDIEVEIVIERSFFAPGEEIVFSVNRCNPTDEVITQTFSCPCCHDELAVLNEDGQEIADCATGCIQPVVPTTWQPGECKTMPFYWEQLTPSCSFGAQVPNGTYRAEHTFSFNHIDYELTTLSPPIVIGEATVDVPTLSQVGVGGLAFLLALVALLRLRVRA